MGNFAHGILVAMTLCGVSQAAYAKADAVPQLQPELRIGVTGIVPVDCSLSQSISAVVIDDLADPMTNMASAARVRLPFNVSCNTPVNVKLKSKSGGLKFDGVPTTDGDFTSLVDYSARVVLPGIRSALSCDSADMAESGRGCSGDVPASMIEGEGAVAVTVRPGNGLLQKGNYSDRVTIIITPVLGSES